MSGGWRAVRGFGVGGLVAALVTGSVAAVVWWRDGEAGLDPGAAAIPIFAEPIPLVAARPEVTRVGALVHRGGLVLSSPDPRFGGLSGILVDDDGSAAAALAVSDRGFWVRFSLEDTNADLTGARDGFILPMTDSNGRRLRGPASDAEGLARRAGVEDRVWVSFEREHRILRYEGTAYPHSRVVAEPAFAGLTDAESNAGLEAIVFLEDESLLAITEATRDADGHVIGWLRGGDGDRPVRLRLEEHWGLTDASSLPGGDVLTLERWFRPPSDLRIRLRRIAGAALRAEGPLDGPVVAEFGREHAMDNMEGLDVRVDAAGRVLVYMVSDDNYNPRQRTLLHLFELLEP